MKTPGARSAAFRPAAVIWGVAAVFGAAAARASDQPPAADQLVDAQTCRVCHVDQYDEWSISQHARQNVQCYECHGGLHSGSFCGCKRCHQAIHRKRFSNWPHVTRFDDKDGADYMCMLCHKAHMGNLQGTLKEGCAVCHGSTGHTAMTDFVHRSVAAAVSPVHLDQYARERNGLAARLAAMPRHYAAPLLLALAVGGYGLCFLLLLPAGYTAASVWGFFFPGRQRDTEQTAAHRAPSDSGRQLE
ncbi:MAG: hypothetical protein JXB62_04700 [Pirellulales bacterium]|nr:hypothetical protein [Pirellulales bacterium]